MMSVGGGEEEVVANALLLLHLFPREQYEKNCTGEVDEGEQN